ncbi:hypothetical protein ACWDYH_35590 [Nocardia goodfellowii]
MTESQAEPEGTRLVTIPATEVKPQDIGSLSVRYTDGVPELVLTSGNFAPQSIPITDGAGRLLATYTATAAPAADSSGLTARSGAYTGQVNMVFDAVIEA